MRLIAPSRPDPTDPAPAPPRRRQWLLRQVWSWLLATGLGVGLLLICGVAVTLLQWAHLWSADQHTLADYLVVGLLLVLLYAVHRLANRPSRRPTGTRSWFALRVLVVVAVAVSEFAIAGALARQRSGSHSVRDDGGPGGRPASTAHPVHVAPARTGRSAHRTGGCWPTAR